MKKATANKQQQGLDFETMHGAGFAPAWKPENAGEFILFRPTNTIRELPKQKGIKKVGHILEVIYKGGNSDNFYRGSGKGATQVELKDGDSLGIMISHNLVANDSLVVENGKGQMSLSSLSQMVIEENSLLKLLFEGKIKIGGGRSVNQFITQAPKGYKEKLSQVSVKKGK